MSSKLVTLAPASTAQMREACERAARLELVAYRRAHGLTCESLAQRLGCSTGTVARWLGAECRIPGWVLVAIRGGKAAA